MRQLLFRGKKKQTVVIMMIVTSLLSFVFFGTQSFPSQDFSGYLSEALSLILQEKDTTLSSSESETVRVKRVVDGDTIEIENGEKVRYIGINTPESVKPKSPVECFGKEANAKNKELVEGKLVHLEKDISDTDKYGRLLRFVYLEDGTFVNDELVRSGYARVSTFAPDVKFADQFKLAEREARENKRGLWAKDTCDGRK